MVIGGFSLSDEIPFFLYSVYTLIYYACDLKTRRNYSAVHISPYFSFHGY